MNLSIQEKSKASAISAYLLSFAVFVIIMLIAAGIALGARLV